MCAVSRRDVELATKTLGYTPRILSLSPVTLEQVLDDIGLVARSAGEAERGVQPMAQLRARLDAVEREKLDLYQRRYTDYVRVAKALQALLSHA